MDFRRATLPLFSLTIFLGAALLFLVQLIFARMALPLLGGAPAVWNTAMVFYQAVLLAGYGYAHLLTSKFRPATQIKIHVAVLLLPLAFLPLVIPAGWQSPTEGSPVLWLFGLLAVAVGLPFFAISTTSPLLQKWFASTGHPQARDPYFLYAASNAGSLLGLLGYPLLIEPNSTLASQSVAWAWGFGILIVFSLGCGLLGRGNGKSPLVVPSMRDAAISPRRRLRWVLCALVPSSLMLSVTTYISSEIAAVPLLWVVPLALYLATFIVVFARRPLIPHTLARRALPLLLVVVVMVLAMGATTPMPLLALVHLLGFFVAALVCHGELANDRPPPERLTEFYLWMSLGGVLGGAFNALLAPVIFDQVYEYPLMLVAAAWLGLSQDRLRWKELLLSAGPALLVVLLLWSWPVRGDAPPLRNIVVFGLPTLGCFLMSRHGPRFALALAGVLLAGRLAPAQKLHTLVAERSFFGVHRVVDDGHFHLLFHGKTVHGMQNPEPGKRRVPLSYFHPTGPLGEIFAATGKGPVAVVGLGAGAIAAYGKKGQDMTFYEIDPVVKRIASDPRYFTYLSDSPAMVDVVIGDARLMLARAPDARYELLVLDAYGSDSVPVHLMTREAFRIYLAKLAPGGRIAFHLSNLHLDLRPVVADLARDAGLACVFQEDDGDEAEGKTGSRWAVMARTGAELEKIKSAGRWQSREPDPRIGIWTDDHSGILPLIDLRLEE